MKSIVADFFYFYLSVEQILWLKEQIHETVENYSGWYCAYFTMMEDIYDNNCEFSTY